MKPKFYAKLAGDTLELAMLSDIGESFFSEGVTAKWVREQLDSQKSEVVQVLINSNGGDMFEGIAIHSLLSADSRPVNVTVLGKAHSAASIIAMAGDEVTMAVGSTMLIHKARSGLMGTAEEMRARAVMLETASDGMVDIYAQRTGLPRSQIVDIVNAETLLSASEAARLGFATRVRNAADIQNLDPAPMLAADTNNEDIMSLKIIAQTLGISAAADEAEVASAARALVDKLAASNEQVAKFTAISGAAADASLGVFAAWKASHERLPCVESELASAKSAGEKLELDTFIAGARDGSGYPDKRPRLTKAMADNLVSQVESKAWTVAAARAFVDACPPVPHLEKPKSSAVVALAGDGEAFAKLKPVERAALKESDPEAYDRMRAAWKN